MAKHAPKQGRIGYDPLLISEESLIRYTDAGLQMVPVEPNLIDAIWTDRPLPPTVPAQPHPLALAGRSSDDKRADVAKLLRDAKQDAAVLTDPASIAWLLNIRGGDVPFTPFALWAVQPYGAIVFAPAPLHLSPCNPGAPAAEVITRA